MILICDCLYVTFLENCPETKNSSLYVDLFFYHENLRKRNETGRDFYSTKLFKICRRESYISRLFWYTFLSFRELYSRRKRYLVNFIQRLVFEICGGEGKLHFSLRSECLILILDYEFQLIFTREMNWTNEKKRGKGKLLE